VNIFLAIYIAACFQPVSLLWVCSFMLQSYYPRKKEPPYPIVQDAVWVQDSAWTLR